MTECKSVSFFSVCGGFFVNLSVCRIIWKAIHIEQQQKKSVQTTLMCVRWLPWQMIRNANAFAMKIFPLDFFSFVQFQQNRVFDNHMQIFMLACECTKKKTISPRREKTSARKFRVEIFEYLTINMKKNTFKIVCGASQMEKYSEHAHVPWHTHTHTRVWTYFGLDWSVAWFSEGANNLLDNCQLVADCSILSVVRFWAAGVSYHTAII